MSVLPSSAAAASVARSSSHASTTIRSHMLSSNNGGGARSVAPSAAAAASPSAPVSPALPTRGSLHLPAQPTVAPTTRRATTGQAGSNGTTTAAAIATAASPGPSASPPPVPLHPSPSRTAAPADANRKSLSQAPPRSSPLPPPIVSPPPSASPPPQLPHPPPSTPTAAPLPNTDDWQLDSEATACHNCAIKFSILTRKHHCRSCGLIHCDNCSKYRSTIPSKHYQDKVRVCGKCYYLQKKQKRSSAPQIASPSNAASSADSPRSSDKAAAVRSESSSGKESRTRSSHSSSAAATAAAVAAAASASAAAAASSVAVHDLESQLSALHALHSSYQPEHHYLTSLLANAAQLEHTYVATIQCLYAFVQQQHILHTNELRQRDAQAAQQQRQIEMLEDTLRQCGIAPPQSHTPSYGYASTPSHSNAGLHPLTSLPRARSTGENTSAALQMQQQQHRSSSPQLLGSSYYSQSLHAASGPSSRASPSLGPLSHRPSSASDRPLSSHSFLFPSQSPPSLQQPSQSSSQISQQMQQFDAASEEAYLEPEEDAADSAPAPAVQKSSSLSFSSRHADYRPPSQQSHLHLPQPRVSPSGSFAPLSLEPPSPPAAPGHSRRASSNPNSASAAVTPRERGGAASNPSSRHGSQKGVPPQPPQPQPV